MWIYLKTETEEIPIGSPTPTELNSQLMMMEHEGGNKRNDNNNNNNSDSINKKINRHSTHPHQYSMPLISCSTRMEWKCEKVKEDEFLLRISRLVGGNDFLMFHCFKQLAVLLDGGRVLNRPFNYYIYRTSNLRIDYIVAGYPSLLVSAMAATTHWLCCWFNYRVFTFHVIANHFSSCPNSIKLPSITTKCVCSRKRMFGVSERNIIVFLLLSATATTTRISDCYHERRS